MKLHLSMIVAGMFFAMSILSACYLPPTHPAPPGSSSGSPPGSSPGYQKGKTVPGGGCPPAWHWSRHLKRCVPN